MVGQHGQTGDRGVSTGGCEWRCDPKFKRPVGDGLGSFPCSHVPHVSQQKNFDHVRCFIN
jgi:hypothetical protein